MLATQTLLQQAAKNMRVRSTASSAPASRPRTSCCAIIGQIGTDGGTGYVIEYTGEAIRALSMEDRMTVCNMSIEAGARAGLIAPDETTFAYLKGRPHSRRRRARGSRRSPSGARCRPIPARSTTREIVLDAADIAPQVTWGTNPGQVLPITGAVPKPADIADATKRDAAERSLEYMGLTPGDAGSTR